MSKSGRSRIFALAFGPALALAAASSAAAAPAAPRKNVETLRTIAAAYERDDCDTVLRLGLPMLDARGGTGLVEGHEAILYDLVAFCETAGDLDARAYAHALRGTALEGSSDQLWRLRLALELDAKKHEAAVATVEAMSQGRGAALNSAPVRWMWRLDEMLEEAGRQDLRRRLFTILGGDSYAPEEIYGANDGFRYRLALILADADAGAVAEAGAIVARLRSPGSLASASLDPRFRPFLPAEVDVRAAAEAQLSRHRELIARHPDRLDPLLDAAADLRQLGRPGEALRLLQTAAPRIDEPKAFSDRDKRLNWYWDALGRTHFMLGDYDAMAAAFAKGAAIAEGGNPNVSQVINLAAAQNSFGRGADALRTLAVFDDQRKSSPYGEMEMRFTRGCARALAGPASEAAADLAFAKAHEKDHPEALANLLLCLGDLDGAAAAFIRRLEDPDRRIGALLQLSDYDDPPVALPPDPVYSKIKALKARPDLKAAIERAGGIRRFRLQRGEL